MNWLEIYTNLILSHADDDYLLKIFCTKLYEAAKNEGWQEGFAVGLDTKISEEE